MADGFDPNNVGCAAINNSGQVAFRWGRVADDGFNTIDGIYRAGRGDGLTTIARTERGPFNFFGFDTSLNDDGRVAFKAELDEELGFDEGLFSGTGGRITTHYLASTSDFDGSDSRPSINNVGQIAFEESVEFENGVFVAEPDGSFTTISAPGSELTGVPILNDDGLAAFQVGFFDETAQEFVEAIVTGDGGPLTTVADTRGEFDSFGFRPPALNNVGDVAFLAFLGGSTSSAIFTGPDPVEDRVIGTGHKLERATVLDLAFCEEGLNDAGELTFRATLEDPSTPEGFRVAFLRAVPTGG